MTRVWWEKGSFVTKKLSSAPPDSCSTQLTTLEMEPQDVDIDSPEEGKHLFGLPSAHKLGVGRVKNKRFEVRLISLHAHSLLLKDIWAKCFWMEENSPRLSP